MRRLAQILPSPAMAVALTALFVALGGTGYAMVAVRVQHPAAAATKRKKQKTPSEASNDLAAFNRYLASHRVPKARFATAAGTAATATDAGHASSADTATNAVNATNAVTAGGAPPTGAAGGALSGSYPRPSLASLPPIQPLTTFESSWADVAIPGDPAGYYKDQLGIVHLTGAIKGGSTSAVAFVLPPGYRAEGYFTAASTTGPSLFTSEGPCVITMFDLAGDVAVDAGCDNALVSLDGITYRPTA